VTTVRLELPSEVLDGLELETARDLGAVVAVIHGVDVVANVVTVASLVPHLRALALAIRGWAAGRSGGRPIVLTIRGKDLDIRVDLSPNVPIAKILKALERMTTTSS
jgi:hypothetical protein